MEESFWVSNRFGEKLEALLRKPSEKGKFPAVLFVSGFGMDLHEYKNSNDEKSKRLVENGFLTVQFNFSIVGTDRELALTDRVSELRDIWDWIKTRNDITATRIGIHAISFGAATTLAANLPEVKTYVFVGGVYWLTKFRKQFEGRGATIYYDKDTDLPRSSGKKTVVGPEFWPSIDAFNPLIFAKNLTAPILVIHGDQDDKIDTIDVKKFFDAVISKQKKLKIFKGGDHGITDVPRPMREEFLQDVITWFKKTL